MNGEKRRHYLRAHIQGIMKLHEADGDLIFDTADISQGGAFILSEILLEIGERVRISFTLPDSGIEIASEAEVVRSTKTEGEMGRTGMALKFIDLSPEQQQAIASYVVQCLNTAF